MDRAADSRASSRGPATAWRPCRSNSSGAGSGGWSSRRSRVRSGRDWRTRWRKAKSDFPLCCLFAFVEREAAGEIAEVLAQDQTAAVQARLERLRLDAKDRARLLG